MEVAPHIRSSVCVVDTAESAPSEAKLLPVELAVVRSIGDLTEVPAIKLLTAVISHQTPTVKAFREPLKVAPEPEAPAMTKSQDVF